MSASNIRPDHVLRGILRRLRINKADLPKTSSLLQMNNDTLSATRNYVLNRYRDSRSDDDNNNNNTGNKSQNHHNLSLAYEYMTLLQNIDERKRLQQLDSGVEKKLSPKEMNRRAAARAGLRLPELNPDLE
mmetsp:Transcript_65796/g.73410  ORF Transcript_65796/g.73410 Transcript_65796/m.73410 type:complete len:131 (+) Transcript_65796:108-500(+)